MDVDLSTDLAALLPLVAPLISGHSDLAIGTRLSRCSRVVRGPKREVISRSYNLLLRGALATGVSDAQCGFKAIRADVAHRLLPLVEDAGWFFDTELLVLAERSGLRIHEVPVDWIDDPDSRVDIVRTAKADLAGIARMLRALATGRLPVAELRAQIGRQPLPARCPASRRAWSASSSASPSSGCSPRWPTSLLFLLLRGPMTAQGANLLALLVTAVANTAANRRLTFGIRGSRGAAPRAGAGAGRVRHRARADQRHARGPARRAARRLARPSSCCCSWCANAAGHPAALRPLPRLGVPAAAPARPAPRPADGVRPMTSRPLPPAAARLGTAAPATPRPRLRLRGASGARPRDRRRAGCGPRCSACSPPPGCSTCGTSAPPAGPTPSTPPRPRPGRTSWEAFFFGSSDAGNSITVDKPPASLWVMELSVRLFGLSSWSILVPEALMGVATVGVLYLAVRRVAGAGAGLLAGAVAGAHPGRRPDVPVQQPRRAAHAADDVRRLRHRRGPSRRPACAGWSASACWSVWRS